MNIDRLQRKLVNVARADTPSDCVPYAFEKRITALIAGRAVADRWLLWASGLWRTAMVCAGVALVAGAATFFLPEAPHGNDLAQDFENTLLASVDQTDILP
jgi:hypothetical protein